MKIVALALAGALAALVLGGGSAALAVTATPSPTHTATVTPDLPTATATPDLPAVTATPGSPDATPTPGPPAIPSNVHFDVDRALVWTDNSDNEDGFRIVVSVGPFQDPRSERHFEVGPNVARFVIPPPETPMRAPCGAGRWWGVSAFNEFGESFASGIAVISLCPIEITLTPTPQLILPPTGAGAAVGGSSASIVPVLLAIGAALLALGALSRRIVRA